MKFKRLILGVIVAAIIIYMIVRKRIQDKEKQSDIDSLKAELEALKAAQGGEMGEKVPSDQDGTDGE